MVSIAEMPEKITSQIMVNQPEPIQKPKIERGMIEMALRAGARTGPG